MANERRLIDANDTLQKIQLECNNYLQTSELTYAGLVIAKKIIEDVPTVDAVEVVHGRWLSYFDGDFLEPEMYFRCSRCGSRGHRITWHYCPNCGAKMDGGNEDV